MRYTTITLLLTLAGCPFAAAQDEALDSREFVETETDVPYTGPQRLRGDRPAPAFADQATGAQPEQPESAQNLDHDDRAVEILQAVAETIREGFTAEVKCYAEGSDALKSFFPKSEGLWSQHALNEDASTWAVRYIGQGTVMTRQQPVEFNVLWQPDRVSWIDHDNAVFNVQRPQGRKSGESFQLANGAYGQANPIARGFAETLKTAATIEMGSPVEVEGVMCDSVAIRDKAEGDPVFWYFGRDDHLPRRAEIVLPENETINGAIRVDFANPVAGPGAVQEADFAIYAPDGYQTDIARIFQDPEEARETNKPLPPVGEVGPPEWMVADTNGEMVSPTMLQGKIAVLYFWGTWSPACEKASPMLAELAAEYEGKPVEFLGMAFREGDPGLVESAARDQGQTWRVFPEADEAVKNMGIRNAPSFIVLGPKNELLFRSGRPRGDNYRELVTQMRGIINRVLEDEDSFSDAGGSGGASSSAAGTRVAPATAERIGRPRVVKKDE